MASSEDSLYQSGALDKQKKIRDMDSCQSSLAFPFHMCRASMWRQQRPISNVVSSWLYQNFTVHAAEKNAGAEKPITTPQQTQSLHESSDNSQSSSPMLSPELQMLSLAYLDQETGLDRVQAIFQKDHRGKNSLEMEYIQIALAQTFVISFFMKYVPEFKLAKQDFIREHHGTVFRTRLEAVRRMQDQVSLRAGLAGGKFAFKMTAFGASFAFLSQMIASYRNKTSVFEYIAAAGITGGLARIHLGLKGLVAGSLVGSFLGSIVGCLAYALLKSQNITQEERHAYAIMSLIEVQKSVEGEAEVKRKVEQLKKQEQDKTLTTS